MIQRVVVKAVRSSMRVLNLAQKLLGEIPLALLDEEAERAACDGFYEASPKYRDPADQRRGLLPFEQRMLERFFPKPPAKLLLHGAGGGRELLTLLAAGYVVDAYEPNQKLLEAANRELAATGAAQVQHASVQTWAASPTGQYDAVFTGWAMWTHVLSQEDRLRVLQAFRSACPAGPVLLSFWRAEPTFDHYEKESPLPALHPAPEQRWARVGRQWVREKILRRSPLERGTCFAHAGFFAHLVSEAELRDEAAMSGYKLAYYERDASKYPHAVLVPEA